MPFDGSGNYTPSPAPNFPAIGGSTISSTYYNAVINDIATALSNTLVRDGQAKPSGNFDWNTKNLTNVGNLTAATATLTAGTIATLGSTTATITNLTSTTSALGAATVGLLNFTASPGVISVAGSEKGRVTSVGFWGFLTTTPLRPAHVKYDSAVVGQYSLIVEGRAGGYGAGVSFQSNYLGGALGEMARITADGESSWDTTPANQDAGLRFYTALDGVVAEKARLTSPGAFGIGTSTPTSYASRLAAVGADLTAVGYFGTSGQGLYLDVDTASLMVRYSSGGGSAGGHLWRAGSTEQMRMGANGKMAIGSTNTTLNLLNLGDDSNGSATVGMSFSTAAIERASITMAGGTGILNITSGYGGYGGVIAFTTNGAERMRLDMAGQLGIGTATPGMAFDIQTASANARLMPATATNNAYWRCQNTGGNAYLGLDNSAGSLVTAYALNVYHSGAYPIVFSTSAAERFRVGPLGQWGIGGANYGTAGQVLTSGGAGAAPTWSSAATGTVTSVSGTGSTNGLSLSGTVTGSGNITLSGSVTSVASGATIDGVTIGYRSIPRSTTSGTAVAGDVGKCIAVSAGITIPNATFAAGDAVTIYNDSAAAITITQGVSLTLRQGGTANTGNRTLAARGMATIWFNTTSEAIISGAGLS